MIFRDLRNTFILSLSILLMVNLCIVFTSCALFEEPSGECELLSIYTKDEGVTHYLHATLKITNTCNKSIYNATVSLEASSSARTYYKTISLDVTVAPDDCVYIPIEMDFTTKGGESLNEKWKSDTLKIISQSWK